MKQNLGRVIILLLITINIFASGVEVILDRPAIYKGDKVSFTIKASGNDVQFPNIKDINGYPIQGVSKSSSTSIINGDISKSISNRYSFSPLKDVVIPSFEVEIDGDIYKTKEKKVSVLKPTQSKKGDDFIVELTTDKNQLYVGESTILTISFKQKINAQADKLNLNKPELSNFWMKKIKDNDQYNEGEYIVQTFKYLIFPQKDGNLTIDAIEADIGKIVRNRNSSMFNDPFFNSFNNQIRWAKIYSNSLNVEVKPLPNDIELYGKFTIDATVDKKEVLANKPINLTISIDGIGNIDDIKKFDLNIDGAIVYADIPKTSSSLSANQYKGRFVQKIAVIGDSDFTIPSIKLSYFDSETKKVKTIQTKPIDIKVKGGVVSQPTTIETKSDNQVLAKPETKIVYKSENESLKYIFFIIGVILGIFGTYLYFNKSKFKKEKDNHITQEIKKIKDDKELFNLLLPYSKQSVEISNILKQLEENIYKKANHKIDKQKLYDYFL